MFFRRNKNIFYIISICYIWTNANSFENTQKFSLTFPAFQLILYIGTIYSSS